MAHPIRPDSYQKMDNFYTATVYEKGAEVVRLYRTLLGVEGFRKVCSGPCVGWMPPSTCIWGERGGPTRSGKMG